MEHSDRLFNPHGRRHFRRRYSIREVWVGAWILVGLALIAAWVGHRGAHPDPELFGSDPRLVPKGSPVVPVDEQRLSPAHARSTGLSAARMGAKGRKDPFADLIPLAPEGWAEGPATSFGPENLFEKINGREGFYKSYGFRKLHTRTLMAQKDPTRVIDIEWFDLARPENAIAAFSAERPSGASTEVEEGGLRYLHRNLLALARGPNYLRLVGGDESPLTQGALRSVARRFVDTWSGHPLPWSFALFGRLGLPLDAVSLEKKNAFSFGFARDVHIARASDDLELFVSVRPTPEAAQAHAERFLEGFSSLGEPEGAYVKDRYLGTYAGVRSHGAIVFGVRGAATKVEANAQLQRLEAAVSTLPAEAVAAALAVSAPGKDEGSEGEAFEDSEESEGELADDGGYSELEGRASEDSEGEPSSFDEETY